MHKPRRKRDILYEDIGYGKESLEQTWSVRTLQRNISSQYYYRMLRTQKPELVEAEIETQKAIFYLQQEENKNGI